MPVAMPWYAKPWRRIRRGTRTLVASVCYLTTGTLSLIIAVITTRGTAVRLVWLTGAVIFLYMGATLIATFVWQRRNLSP